MGKLISGDIRKSIIPAADLDLQGDTGEPLKLLTDVDVELAILSLANAIRPRLAQAGNAGGLLISALGDATLVIGSHANLSNAQAFIAAGTTNIFDTLNLPNITIFGNCSTAINVTPKWSADGQNFFSETEIAVAAGADFVYHRTAGARFVLLHVSAACVLTATAQAKA